MLAVVLAAVPAAGQAADATTDETKLLIPDAAAGTGTGAAAGGAAAAPATTVVRAPGVDTWDFVRMLLVLALVVGLIYGVFWLLRRGTRRRTPENEMIRVLGSRSLAGNRALHLVEVGRSVYLVGSAESGVNLVAEVKDQETLDSLRVQAAEEGGKVRRTFAATLARVFSPPKAPGLPGSGKAPGLGEGADFLRRQRERLRRLGGGR
ncbi:MAG: flagellar biosynthetic protein FliO [Spirochaetes bacterium]|nr:flagellar biosynthetic protein FliO [Spirochaetota bacterium]